MRKKIEENNLNLEVESCLERKFIKTLIFKFLSKKAIKYFQF